MLTGTKLEYTRKYNRRIIMEAIRRHGPISRAEVAQMTGLTTATLSNFTSELMAQGIILEKGRRKGRRGQPAIELEINPDGGFAIGFELGRDNLSGVLMNLAGQILGEVHDEWEYPVPEIALPIVAVRVQHLLAQTTIPQERLLGIGVAIPGPFLTPEKRVVLPRNFPHWEKFPIIEKLTEMLGFEVLAENDAMAAAIGEQFHGDGSQYNDFFYIYLGAGIGGAMIHKGHSYRGFSPDTGEVGWLRHNLKGRRALISNYIGLGPLYNFLRGYGLTVTRPHEVENLFQQQNPYLWEWLNEAVECLGDVLDAINSILGPEAIFLGGRFPAPLLDYLIERLRLEIEAARASQPDHALIYQARLCRAASGELASAIGAATLPLYETFSTQHSLLHRSHKN